MSEAAQASVKTPETRKVAVFGDSIVEGLGVRNGRYIELVCQRTGLELADYSGTGSTIAESLQRFRDNSTNIDYAVIAHGVTEPIIRPHPRLLRFLPPRYRRRGWMDPRAYFSRRRWKRTLELTESATRWRLKNALLRIGGGYQLMSIEDYEKSLRELIALLESKGADVLVLGPPPLSERYFPGSPRQQQIYEQAARRVSPAFIALSPELTRWEDFFLDHFHPNDQGHRKIADVVEGWIGSRRGT